MHRHLTSALLSLLIISTQPLASAMAHTIVTEAIPTVGSIAIGPDVAIKLRLNSRIDHQRSRLTLTLPDGTTRDVPIDRDTAPGFLTGTATGLAPGEYSVRWQVLSIDGHITRGDIPFSVRSE